jgi:biopolymer transport protein ExbD
MKFGRRRRRPDVAIDLTSLIDVVFLLLIFFMVSTTFVRQTKLEVKLPEAKGQLRDEQPDVVQVTVTADGSYAIDDRTLVNSELATLVRALAEVTRGDQSRRVIITADANATHQSVVRAMDAAGQVGLIHLSITTRSPDTQVN